MIINPTFRYLPKPSVPTPVSVRSCGHYFIQKKEWHDLVKTKNFLQLFWGIRGAASLIINDKTMILYPETVCFYLPGDRHNIALLEAPLEYCFLTFDGDNLDNLIKSFQITREPRHAGPCPLELFLSLDLNLHDCTPYGEYLASADGYRILSLAFAGKKQENTVTEKFKTFVAENLADPSLSPAVIANKLGIHPTTLTRNISSAAGMNPVEYITAFRLQQALTLIQSTTWSFKEIAQETGFANANYFAKVFRKKFGCSPTEFRRGGEFHPNTSVKEV